MRNINPGNLLPFFRATTHQSHLQAGSFTRPLLCRSTVLVPFQVMITPPDNPASVAWRAVACDGTETSLDAAALSVVCLDGLNTAVVTYNGGTLTALDCGVYYIEIDADGVTILYSDLIQVVTATADMVLLSWGNDTDFGGVLYQNGYTQKMLTRAYFDRPQIEEQRETAIDGYGVETTKFTRIIERLRFEALPVHDACIMALMNATQCDTVTITYMDTSEAIAVTNLRVETRPFGNSGNVPAFTCDRTPSINTGCGDNYTIIECPTIE